MFRYLFKENSALARFVRIQYKNYKNEEMGYMAALLARYRQEINKIRFESSTQVDPFQLFNRIYEEVNQLEIDEHWEIAKGDHLEQIFNIFDILNKHSRNKEIVINRRYEELSTITALVDPNKFPIFSLIEVVNSQDLVSLWDYRKEVMQKVKEDLGFSLKIDKSRLEHHEAGDGVFLECHGKEESKVGQGTLLGFVPGIIYDALSDFEANTKGKEKDPDEYLHRYDDTVVDFTNLIPYPYIYGNSLEAYNKAMVKRSGKNAQDATSIYNVSGDFINPYAKGHKINHAPKNTTPNVTFLDMFVPNHFFSQEYLKFMPNVRAFDPVKTIRKGKGFNNLDYFHVIGVFAIRDILDGEELYTNYFESNQFEISHQVPDWLVRLPPLPPQFTKQEFEHQFTFLAKLIDSILFRRYASVYEQFERKVSHDPDRHQFEEDKFQGSYFSDKLKKKKQ